MTKTTIKQMTDEEILAYAFKKADIISRFRKGTTIVRKAQTHLARLEAEIAERGL